MRFNAYTSYYRALSLCRGLEMNVHVVRNPTGWYGHTPYYGVMINGHVAHNLYAVAWRWMLMMHAISRCGMGTLRVVV